MRNLVIVISILMFISMNAIAKYSINIETYSGQTASDGWDKDKVNKFIKKAGNISLMEVKAGQLALQNSSSQQVRDFAQILVQDYSASNQKLTSTIVHLESDVPTTLEGEYQTKIDRLSNVSATFDKEYIDMVVNDHKDAISEFEKALENVKDPALKSWIDKTLTMIRRHSDEAQNIKNQLK